MMGGSFENFLLIVTVLEKALSDYSWRESRERYEEKRERER
jgi:hypothetical protein